MFTLFQNDFMPHGFCIKWSWDLLTWYVVSDGFIFLSYSYIGIALILFARKYIGLAWNRLLWLFSFFVLACGITHLMDIVTFWQPIYWLDAILKSVTAVLSFITAIYLEPKIPELLNLHSNDDVMREFLPQHTYKVIPDIARALISNPNEVNELKNQFSGKFVIGHVGALDNAVKNQSLILKVANQLRENENLVFMMLGIGKDEMILKNFAAQLNLTNVVFEGFKENIADYYALFDIFIYPSKEEGLGSAILEAFNFKCPVIAANIGGIPDILGDDAYGLLINPHSEYELAQAVMKLYEDKSLREHYAQAGFERRADFSAAEICAKYDNIYKLCFK